MIKLKETHRHKIEEIDNIVTALNAIHAKTPSLIETGMKAIHTAIVTKA